MLPANSCIRFLYEAGFSNQPNATDRDDGLELKDLYITAAVRCAPPDNKPLPQELANCAPYLDREMDGLENVRVVVALGRIGFEAYLNYLKRRGLLPSKNPYPFQPRRQLQDARRQDLAGFLPSLEPEYPDRKLTRQMFAAIFKEAATRWPASRSSPKASD